MKAPNTMKARAFADEKAAAGGDVGNLAAAFVAVQERTIVARMLIEARLKPDGSILLPESAATRIMGLLTAQVSENL